MIYGNLEWSGKMQVLCENYLSKLQEMPLFDGIEEKELESILNCLCTYVREYKKDEYIILYEDSIDSIGIILEGNVQMIREDSWGNKVLVVSMAEGELFGETFTCGGYLNSTVSFIASKDSRILFVPFRNLMRTCTKSCVCHHRLMENMVVLIANKNLSLIDRVDVLSKKTLREKISTYLIQQSAKNNSTYFDISLGRVQLAEYLCADRSALTRELNSMKKEGLIDFNKNTFTIMKKLYSR